MTTSPNSYPTPRAPRVKLAGSVLALIQLSNRQQVRAKLHQLNINGGLLLLSEPLQEDAPVQVMFHIGSTTVRAQAETISPMWATQGCLQAFRFTGLGDDDRRSLDADLQLLLGSERPAGERPGFRLETDTDLQGSPSFAETDREVCDPNADPAALEAMAEEEALATGEFAEEMTEVTLYFNRPEDAIRFTVALSSVVFSDDGARTRDEVAKLAREFPKISRVTTKGRLLHSSHRVKMLPSQVAALSKPANS
jgi:hypothetical protein